jgi:hypothetical protein
MAAPGPHGPSLLGHILSLFPSQNHTSFPTVHLYLCCQLPLLQLRPLYSMHTYPFSFLSPALYLLVTTTTFFLLPNPSPTHGNLLSAQSSGISYPTELSIVT